MRAHWSLCLLIGLVGGCLISTNEELWKRPKDKSSGEQRSADGTSLVEGGGERSPVIESGQLDRKLALEGKPATDRAPDSKAWPDIKKLDSKTWPDTRPPPDLVPPCTSGTFECLAGNTARYCSGGVWKSVGACPLGCSVAAKACLRPSNVSADLTTAGSGDIQIGGTHTINTDTGEISGIRPAGTGLHAGTGVHYQQLPALGIFSFRNFGINAASELRAVGTRALVVLASNAVTISGLLQLSASGSTPGPGGQAGGLPGLAGSSGSCGGKATTGDNYGKYCTGGGGGGANGGAGGAGGACTCAAPHDFAAGAGGTPTGSTSLIPLTGGCGGAGGAKAAGASDTNPGPGGGGGGAVQISAVNGISFTAPGGINAGGGGGGETVSGGGAGGGAGGSILLESPSITLPSGAVLAANGGGGGGGDCT